MLFLKARKSTRSDLFCQKEETIPLKELRSLQLKKLKRIVSFVASKSLFYQGKKNLSTRQSTFSTLREFSEVIPLTTKDDLLGNGIYENLCVPRNEISEIHFSSGTTNKPVYSLLSSRDIAIGNRYLARTWYMQGIRQDSIFAMFAQYGLFSAGLINHYAIQHIGSYVVPASNCSVSRSFQLLQNFQVDSCAAVASYYPYLLAMAEINNIDLNKIKLKKMIAGGEPFTEKQRLYIEQKFGSTLYDQYGLCEINTGLAGECDYKNGLHILADYVYPEIIDPATGSPLPDGSEGELVLTTFHKEASPLLRYRTGDITSINYDKCECGRTMPRISRIKRRVSETLFYKGIKIEKPFVADLLEGLKDELNPYIWQLQLDSIAGKDELTLKICPLKNGTARDKIMDSIKQKIGFEFKISFFDSNELVQMSNSKHRNFVDNRVR